MKILVIATHHGAFLTLAQIKHLELKNVSVVIPQSQIDKYKGFEGTIFQKYEPNLKRFCKGMDVHVSSTWDAGNKFLSAFKFLDNIGATGKWLVLEAGSLLGDFYERIPAFNTTFAGVYTRVHENYQKLYTMLGEAKEIRVTYTSSFYVNMDEAEPSFRITYIDTNVFQRPDVLFAKSFGPLSCIRYQQAPYYASTMNFWMEAIRAKQEEGEWVAYPYDVYAEQAKEVKRYLPESSYKNIIENGKMTDWLSDLVDLDL